MGNWFFIGIIYIDKDLPVDKPNKTIVEHVQNVWIFAQRTLFKESINWMLESV